jgi:hypothetical protein
MIDGENYYCVKMNHRLDEWNYREGGFYGRDVIITLMRYKRLILFKRILVSDAWSGATMLCEKSVRRESVELEAKDLLTKAPKMYKDYIETVKPMVIE